MIQVGTGKSRSLSQLTESFMIPINKQEPLKADHGDGSTLLVHSIFHTIQGEGPHVGKPAVFIRLAGCNLQCPGCDTEYTKNVLGVLGVGDIIALVRTAVGDNLAYLPLVVITGGEPFRQNLGALIYYLRRAGYKVQVETNGTLGCPEALASFDIVVSPKAGKVHPSLFSRIIAYKYVLDSDHISEDDGLPTSVLGMPAAPARPHLGFEGDVYVQPADEPTHRNPLHEYDGTEPENYKNDENLAATIKSAMKYGYRLCIQTHKIIGLE